MYDIRHRVGIDAPASEVYEQLATTDGLATWWTRRVEGDPAIGGRLGFSFGSPDPSAVMEVVDLRPDARVEWRCIDGPAEWIDTRVQPANRSEWRSGDPASRRRADQLVALTPRESRPAKAARR